MLDSITPAQLQDYSEMSRLADYFVVVGYDHGKERGGISNGSIVQRFPENDWSDTPFIEGIEWFCQPQGWALSTERQEPRFFVSILTDIDANRHYCACLCFNETVSIIPSKPVDEEEEPVDGDSRRTLVRAMPTTIAHHSIMYAPKCLVLVSRLDYIETFKNCLGIIYTVYVENLGIPLETLVGNILGCIQVPPAGGPQVRFSIGAGDRQALQPPISPSLPITHTSVNLLFQQLGIRNVLVLFCAVMTEHKIIFHSVSYSRLTEGCRALTALMYPFRYSHVYIPLLPAALVEILSTPTPFIMGVHSSLKYEVSELMDVIVVDLDGGSITVPDGISLALLPEPLLSQTQHHLSLVLQPELNCADYAFPPLAIRAPHPPMLDKELRAVFMRTFAQLLQGYRSCLTIIRIHPKPVITFHKAAFLGERCLTDCDFTIRVLDCMFFTSFVAERGPPWRVCDVWDELYNNMSDQLKQESQDQRLITIHIQELAQQLYTNENPNPQPYVQKILKPPDGAFARIHQPQLPIIHSEQVQAIIDEGLAKNNLKVRLSSLRPLQPRIVPSGPHISIVHDTRYLVSNSARRLEVLRNCINCIFDNKISDARKTFPAVLRALKSKAARLALCMEFSQHVVGNKAMLEHQQFDLVVRLMNCALQGDSSMDEHGVAAALLPLATAFCRKLCTGVIQFAYTCIQEHAVWQNQQFWEDAFYQDVQKDVKRLYLPGENFKSVNEGLASPIVSPKEVREKELGSIYRSQEPSALEIAAEQMRMWSTINPEKQRELITSEESTLYSQAIHYANRMVYLLVPLDIGSKTHRQDNIFDDERASTSITNSGDAESGFEETDPGETGNAVIRMVSRFVDRVCTEGGVSTEHVRCLHQMVPGVVHMHIETLEAVHRESKTLPPIQKPKILTPNMLPGEEVIMDGLRVYLLPDGREEGTGGLSRTPPLLPAEGAIFLTNYRIVFKGLPCDPSACEQMVVRAFPVTSLTKEKRVSVQHLAHFEQCMQEACTVQVHEGLQLRSCTFQLIKLAFDEEVTPENIDTLRKLINKARYPPHIFHHFAFNGQIVVTPTANHKGKEKNATLKGFAKKTLLKTARKAGFKPKQSSKRQKYVLPNMNMNINKMNTNLSGENNKYLTSPGRMNLPVASRGDNDLSHDDDLSIDEFEINDFASKPLTDVKTLERLSERSYVRDWYRLGLSASGFHHNNRRSEPFRLTSVNCAYMICRSYPALLVVPTSVTDESIRRLCRFYRHSRFPVVTWRHSRTKALLIRGAGCHGKGVMGMLKAHPSSASNLKTTSSESTSTLEQEKYIMSWVSATPLSVLRKGSVWGMSDSTLSIDSVLLTATSTTTTTTTTTTTAAGAGAAAAAAAVEAEGAAAAVAITTTTTTTSTTKATTITGDDRNHNETPEQARRNLFNKSLIGVGGGGGGAGTGVGVGAGGGGGGGESGATLGTSAAGKGVRNFGRWGSLKDRRHNSQASLASVSHHQHHPHHQHHHRGTIRHSTDSDSGTECVHTFQRASLYILGEKSNMKGVMKTGESSPKTDFIPVDYFDIRHTKNSFKKLMRACMPSSQNIEPDQSFYKLIESSEWLQQLQNLMQLSGAVIDLMDVQGSSVCVCLEDGWDTTTTVCSVAQVCLDPHYRTIDGFRTLIEKEWLGFGYRFGHRSNLSANSQVTNFTPTFLQFLDIVHQIQNQFPLAFEFNDYYLKFLAYHMVSCRFRTFLLDCEFDRVECGITAVEDKRGSLTSHHKGVDTGSDDEIVYPGGRLATGTTNNTGSNLGQSIFDYIEKQHTRLPIFYNFMYTPNSEHLVLRPVSHMPSLDIWEYYFEEELAHGPSYDLEVLQQDIQQEEEAEAADGIIVKSNRKIVTNGYDSVNGMVPDQFSHLLEEIHKLETELGHLPQKWKILWDKLELPNTDSLTRHASLSTALVRYHGKLIHKRSTLELLLRGKLAGASGMGSGGGGGGSSASGGGDGDGDGDGNGNGNGGGGGGGGGSGGGGGGSGGGGGGGGSVAGGGSGSGGGGGGGGSSSSGNNASGNSNEPNAYAHPHRFERLDTATPTHCDACSGVLWGPVKAGLRCVDCGHVCHDKCVDAVPKNCTKYKAVANNIQSHTLSRSGGDNGSVNSSSTMQTSLHQYYEQFSSNVAENRTHEGYLYKRGALLKGWKQRWFVLDSIKHQLRYYDAMEDSHYKSYIDLAEAVSVTPAVPTPGPPKKTDDKSFFDLRTNKRTYNFCASDALTAQEWIEKLQACLQ